MSISDSMKKLIGIEEIDDDDTITEAEVEAEKEKISETSRQKRPAASEPRPERPRPERSVPTAPRQQKQTGRRFTVTDTNAFKLVLIEPKSFEECPKLVDSLKARKPIIINLEQLETGVARKIFDFLSGATYALNGNVQKVANNIFVFAPENVDIAGGQGMNDNTKFSYPKNDTHSDNPWR
jgi:cell division inhibitor SepF